MVFLFIYKNRVFLITFFTIYLINWIFYIIFAHKIVTKHQSIVYVEDITCYNISIPDYWG